jgi:hypothetical protein
MPQTVTQELALIIKAQAAQAIEALENYEQSVGKASEAMKESGDTAEKASDATEQAAKSNEKITETEVRKAKAVDFSINSLMKQIGAYTSVAVVIGKVIQLYRESFEAGENLVTTDAKLEAVIRATGKASEMSLAQIGLWAESLREATGVSEQQIKDMAAGLTTFKKIGSDIIPEVLELSIDLAKTWGDSLPSASKKLGRALEDPIKGMNQLEESGVMLDSQMKTDITSMVEMGDTAGAQRILLDALSSRVGGVATSMANALGPLNRYKTVLGEIKAEIGKEFLNIPGLEAAARSLNAFLANLKSGKVALNLNDKMLTGQLDEYLATLNSTELEIALKVVTDKESAKEVLHMQANYIANQEIMAKAISTRLDTQREIEAKEVAAAEAAAKKAETEAWIADELRKQQDATLILAGLYSGTEEGRKSALEEQISLLQKQKSIDDELVARRGYIDQYGNEENRNRLAAAIERLGMYDAIIAARQAELADMTNLETPVIEDYIIKILGKSADAFVLDIPVSFDFDGDRSQKKLLEEQLSALKSQINKLWSAGPSEGDTGAWQESLEVLAGKYSDIAGSIKGITDAENIQARAQELRESLLTEEQLAIRKKVAYEKELLSLEADGLITHLERRDLWDKEYGQIARIMTAGEMLDQGFKDMGDTLYKQLLNAESLGSSLSGMFADIGAAAASGGSGIDAIGESASQFLQSMLGQISSMALASGLRILAETGIAGLPIALGLFAIGGVAGITSGLAGGSGAGLDDSILSAMEDEVKARGKLADSINDSIDQEYQLLKRQLDRNLISVEEFKAGATDLQSQRNYEDAKVALSSATSSAVSSLDEELAGMSGWSKFWSGRDEEIAKQAAQIQALFDAIDTVTDADQLRTIMARLTDLGVDTSAVPAFANGGDFITNGPQIIKVGDNIGGREHVRITPIGNGGATGSASQIININGDVYGIEDLYGKLQAAGVKLGRKKLA